MTHCSCPSSSPFCTIPAQSKHSRTCYQEPVAPGHENYMRSLWYDYGNVWHSSSCPTTVCTIQQYLPFRKIESQKVTGYYCCLALWRNRVKHGSMALDKGEDWRATCSPFSPASRFDLRGPAQIAVRQLWRGPSVPEPAILSVITPYGRRHGKDDNRMDAGTVRMRTVRTQAQYGWGPYGRRYIEGYPLLMSLLLNYMFLTPLFHLFFLFLIFGINCIGLGR